MISLLIRRVPALLGILLLAGCSGIGKDDMASALQMAWSEDATGMSTMAGTELPGGEPGELRGVAGSAKAATDLARQVAGQTGSDLAAGAINGASRLAEDFGMAGASDFRAAVGIATARDWKVRNLEVLSERDSGDDHVASVRYDLGASIQGAPVTIARDVTHEVRFVKTDDGWRVERQQ